MKSPRENESMRPGDIRAFKSGRKVAMVMAVGLWAERRNPKAPIHIHLTGTPTFNQTTVTNKPGKRCHENLFAKLRLVLKEQGRWPFGEE